MDVAGKVHSASEGPMAGADEAVCIDDLPSTVMDGIGVEGLEVGGVGPRDTHPTPVAAEGSRSPGCAVARAWDAPLSIAESTAIPSRCFPFGGPNLMPIGAFNGTVLRDFL